MCGVLSCRSALLIAEWRWGGVWSCCVFPTVLSCLFFFFLFLFVLVFGVVRAQPCEHARYPRTPLCPLVVLFLLSFPCFSFPCLSSRLAFSVVGMTVGDSPCVTVLCWHDGDGESVSFVFVFLVVACSSFAVSAVASSAVAFGAQHSAVVWVVGSA